AIERGADHEPWRPSRSGGMPRSSARETSHRHAHIEQHGKRVRFPITFTIGRCPMQNYSRRRFLTGAGASALAVGASAVALPFLRKSAHAQSCSPPPPPQSCSPPPQKNPTDPPGSPTDNPPPLGCSNVVNTPSPNPWFIRGCCNDTVCGYNTAKITV